MRRAFIESDTRVLFASRSAIGGWTDTWPECVDVASKEMHEVLSTLFGAPVPPSPGNTEDNVLLVGPILLFAGLMAVATMMATKRLSRKDLAKAN